MTSTPKPSGRYQQSILFEQDREKLHRNVLSSVSHDLKTPLACIIGSLEIYERTKSNLTEDKRDVLISTALQEAYRLDSFITNILDMANLESGTVKLKRELSIMDLLLDDCLIMLGRRLQACEVNITAIPATFPINIDPLLLARAICILLDNAAKYGSAHPIIDIEYEKTDDHVIIRVSDNGSGIPKSKLEDIFCKYTRYDKQDYKQAGTGLGLPICREIMTLLGGSVTAANREKGKGAVFTLTFPA